MIKGFESNKWWEQKNPAFRQACFRLASKELIELKGKYDYFIKQTNNK